ncbi:MAG: threonylcarbamoyladenosine tRNA methylthiotransferase MtaB, partial [Granulosicoccus sp.]
VLFEKENRDGMMFGFTDNYLRVSAKYEASQANTIRKVQLVGLSENVFNSTLNNNAAVAV